MHDIDRTLIGYNPETELMPEAFEYGEAEWPGETGETGVFSENEEMELAAELLGVASEQELDRFLGGLIKKASQAVGKFVKSPTGQALGGILKGAAKQALPVVGHGARGVPGWRKRCPVWWAGGCGSREGLRPGTRRAQSRGPGI